MFNQFSLELYNLVWAVLGLQTNFMVALLCLFILTWLGLRNISKWEKTMNNYSDLLSESLVIEEALTKEIECLETEIRMHKNEINFLQDKVVKFEEGKVMVEKTSCTLKSDTTPCNNKKTWKKVKPNTLSRSQVFRRKKLEIK